MGSLKQVKKREIGLYFQVVHQVIIICSQLVFKQLFTKIIFHIILVSLKGRYNIRDFQFVDLYRYFHHSRFRINIGIKLFYLCIIPFNQPAYFIKRIIFAFYFQNNQTTRLIQDS